jgi:hypothetical protein
MTEFDHALAELNRALETLKDTAREFTNGTTNSWKLVESAFRFVRVCNIVEQMHRQKISTK